MLERLFKLGENKTTAKTEIVAGIKKALAEMGGEFRSIYMTLGDYDLVFIYEAPDDAVAARFMLLLGQLGTVRTRTLKAFPEAAYREIIHSLR